MKKSNYWLAVILMLIVSAPFRSNVTAYDMSEYHPMAAGDMWITCMTLTVTGGEAEGTYGPFVVKTIVNGTKLVNGVETVHFESSALGSKNVDHFYYVMDDEGFKLYETFERTYEWHTIYDQPYIHCPAQFGLGEHYDGTYSVTVYNIDDDTLIATATGNNTAVLESVEDVTVPAGTFKDCIKIVGSYTEKTSTEYTNTAESTTFLYRNVGPIKSNSTTHMELEEGDITIVTTNELIRASIGGKRYGPCAAEMLLGPNDAKLAVMRQFRDKILANNAAGKKLIDQYYNNDETIMEILYAHPVMRKMAKNILETLVPTMKLLIAVNK